MASIKVGTICVKLLGRESGSKCVVVDLIDKNYTLITGPKEASGVKRRRANIKHLQPTEEVIKIRKGATDDDIFKALRRAKKEEFMKEKVKPAVDYS